MRTAIILNNLPPAGCVGNRDENASARRVRILYAEDNATVRLTAGWILARAGYSATTVEDGSEAWEALQSKRYDLLITDNEMPSLSGPELVSMARCHGMRLPVIVASGTLELSAAEGQQLRVAATLQKPFTADELLETIERVLFGASDAAGEKKDTRPDDCGTAEADLPHVREWDISE